MKINSIFESISGEGGIFPQGMWCTFVRVQGCMAACKYCDTKQAQDAQQGTDMTIEDVMKQVKNRHVLITGGEPLEQRRAVEDLCDALLAHNHHVQIETNGLRTPFRSPSVGWVVDWKLPSSGIKNMPSLRKDAQTMCVVTDEFLGNWHRDNCIIKFVIDPTYPVDLEDAIYIMQYGARMYKIPRFLVSPVNATGEAIPDLVERIRGIDAKLLDRIVFSVQLHKLINLP